MDEKYLLKYVPNARARTDPMKDHSNLMNQRRRWINSSLFAFMYVWRNYSFNVMDSKHNFLRRYITLNISMLIAMISTINSYITPSIYFFVLYATIYQLGFSKSEIVAAVVCLIYLIVFLSAVAGALTGRQWSKHAQNVSAVLSIFTFLLLGLVAYNIVFIYIRALSGSFDTSNITLMIILILTGLNLGCYFIIMIVHVCSHPK
jgi:cellulose synthase/poly-beta-1,6-N-acetylglucosamine synthase-like glycosyltransferase